MDRRLFITKAGVAAGALVGTGLVASKASAQTTAPAVAGASVPAAPVAVAPSAPVVITKPSMELKLSSSFPESLDTIFGAAAHFAKRVGELTGGKISIQVVPAGKPGIAPTTTEKDKRRKGPDALWAVTEGRADIAHTCSYYYVDEDKAFGFGTAVPFGLNSRQLNAWMTQGGGLDLLNSYYSNYGLRTLPGGNTGTQMGGWWRKEVKTLSDLKGLNLRIGGLGGMVSELMGSKRVSAGGGELYSKIKAGEIDAAEWVGPYDDEKLKLWELAKNYYYPGWWEPGATINFFFKSDFFEKLSAEHKIVFQVAMADANARMQEQYDHLNPIAVSSLLDKGVKFRRFSEEIMRAAYHASHDLYASESAKNPAFKKIFTQYDQYRKRSNSWMSMAEAGMDSFIQRMR